MSSTPYHFLRISMIGTVALILILFVLAIPFAAYAQFGDTAIAKTYLISGEAAEPGDLVSFDTSTQTFHLTQKVGDPNVFGVVATSPAIVLRTSTEGVPLVSFGEVYVQVTTINGPISAGDLITSSSISGKGQKADSSASFIVGTALDSFPTVPTNNTSTGISTSTVDGGSIHVLLAIGPKSPDAEVPLAIGPKSPDAEGSGTGAITDNPTAGLFHVLGVSVPLATLIKYALAALVVIGSIYVAFRNFGSNMKDSIISVGRNPLAKTSIQSMVVLNTALIVFISIAGLFVGLLILFVKL